MDSSAGEKPGPPATPRADRWSSKPSSAAVRSCPSKAHSVEGSCSEKIRETVNSSACGSGIRASWVSCWGSITSEVVPADSPEGRSCTRMSCRWDSRPTTNRPIRREMVASTVGGSASFSLISAKSSAVRPMPLSWISISTRPSGRLVALTSTRVCGEENEVAFSSNSASRWTRSVTAGPTTSASGMPASSMRS